MSYRFIPQLADEEIRLRQEEGLRWTVRRAWNSPQYSSKLRACGLEPGDAIGLDDLSRLPTVDVEDLREGYPLPLLCVPPTEVVRIHASSGTTGKRKILAYTAADVETFNLQMARCYELAGLTAYDTQRLKQIAYATRNDIRMTNRLAISGALALYLDFINLFLLLLRIMGDRR